jgi:hypothetical protein
MSTKIVFISMFLFSVLIFFSECKKYDDDDVFIQWKRPEKRLIKFSPWKFDKLMVNGIDKSEEFRSDSAFFYEISFSEPKQIGYGTDVFIYRFTGFDEVGRHTLTDKNKNLSLGILNSYINHSDYPNYGPVFSAEYIEWEILRMSKKGMTLKTNYHSSEYILYLKASQL